MFPEPYKLFISIFLALFIVFGFQCNGQDPWDLAEKEPMNNVDDNRNIPPDLRIIPKRRPSQTTENHGLGEWFYRRILSIVLKGGQVKENEDGSVDISLQMKLDQKQWNTLDEYLASTSALTEDKFRRSLGYIEQSIYEPSIPSKIILSTSEFIFKFIADYKVEMTWTLAMLAALGLIFWLWRHVSHRNTVIIIAITMYAYEVFVSYKEAEQKEIELFVAAVNSCRWHVWSSECEMPKPNLLIFLKHMYPLKIGVRMCSTLISEPILVLSDTVRTLTHGITDGLMYPLDIIMNGIIYTIFITILLIVFITILCNYVLNIPINLSFWLFSVGLRQRNRTLFNDNNQQNQCHNAPRAENTNAITGATLDKLLDVFSRALNTPNQQAIQNVGIVDRIPRRQLTSSTTTGLKRSASTGRLPNQNSFENLDINLHTAGGGDSVIKKRSSRRV